MECCRDNDGTTRTAGHGEQAKTTNEFRATRLLLWTVGERRENEENINDHVKLVKAVGVEKEKRRNRRIGQSREVKE
jgi:hypothetical protein